MATAAAYTRLLQFHFILLIIMMDRNVLIGMLRQGKTGDQLLQILEVITAETQNEVETEAVEADIQF